MKPLTVLLVVDRRFMEVDGGIYTEGPTGAETGERYLDWFDQVIVAGRRGATTTDRLHRLNRVLAPGHRVECLPDISGLVRRARGLREARHRLLGLIEESDAVIARLPSELGFEAANLAESIGKPCAIDVGGCVLDGMRTHGSVQGTLYASFAYWRMRRIIGRAGWIAYVTQNFLQNRYPPHASARTLACSDVVVPLPDSRTLDKRLESIASNRMPLTFGTIGSLYGPFKGIQHALAAFELARPKLPDFRYRVLGGGDPEPWRRLAERHGLSDHVIYDGVLPAGGPVLEWLDSIDIYLQPSLREGLPRALIEAMSRAAPAIASNVAGIPELVPSDWLHAPGDVSRLADLLVRASSAETRESMARYAWDRAAEFSPPLLRARRDEFWSEFRHHAAHARNT